MPSINAGKYRHRITIKGALADASRDTYGRRKGTATTIASNIWAEKQDWLGDETTENGRETATVSTRWKIRYRTDVLPEMQLVHGSDIYDIMGVLDFEGTKRELVLNCRKVLVT